ncbi:MAG TPA: bifunctional precorrin-2 dehydrogenase/sirohydrochlorin ferrochelatase [Actinomycetota bacterium]|nr:bifunctional precorrin-2 dehydrogenase/sirohydrochlorin ferrochelatase [Actinomycetota bacterium]
MSANDLYVACIDLRGKRVLVVGGGPIGTEKVLGLLSAHAEVTVVAPDATDELRELAASGTITWQERPYGPTDLDGRFLVIAATGDDELNREVHRNAEARDMLVNVADVPNLCNFILPAISRNGPLAVAISTNGASPALAKRMRRESDALFDDAYARLAELLETLRPWAKRTLPTYADRKAFFEDLVEGDPDPIELLRSGREAALVAILERKKLVAAERFSPSVT